MMSLLCIEVMKGFKISNGESQVDLAINMAATQELLGLTSRGAGIRGLYDFQETGFFSKPMNESRVHKEKTSLVRDIKERAHGRPMIQPQQPIHPFFQVST